MSAQRQVLPAEGVSFEVEVPLVIVGAGAAGLVAALAAIETGVEPLVLERDPVPRGSTALSAGLIPAAGTRFQEALGIADTPDLFARDIQRKAHGDSDPGLVSLVTAEIPRAIEWLADAHGLPFSVVNDFNYPGHSARRMHGLPSRSGRELVDALRQAAESAGVQVLTGAAATTLFAGTDGRIAGVAAERPDGTLERIGCRALVLACNGYGGNPDLVRRHIPEMDGALYFGHPGNTGDAALWGEGLGAELRAMSAYQGHGSVAHPHGILVTWAVVMEGGFQVDTQGHRFSNETHGYSEQAAIVLRQPGGIAWDVFDARIAGVARQFEDFRQAEATGAVLRADTVEELAGAMHVPEAALRETFQAVDRLVATGGTDAFGRSFSGVRTLAAPFHAVKVTGALFHTQGGLAVGTDARVLRTDGGILPNLFAAGGAAVGVSGLDAAGYLSGNGLLTAVALGRIAGKAAARLVRG
ncbi:FAD-dependent oxidoreductase [uncultured Alsobacter sp.]|uniref:FAD-dependent oxidoreductase n=1 Tax=uncultured Alsobacter sp. TaxID=1748258 RepID=UPI0025F65990|nr:FAD-dependent oxidoreductase [uncultured Alsobacter sp.]